MSSSDSTQVFIDAFSNAEAVAKYRDGPRRFVPGFDALHQMTGILLGERVAADGRVLVLGAGGGLEIKALADQHPGWRFVGVDPSEPMLRLAEQTLGEHLHRVELVHGFIDDAPEGPFDGATCLLTLHFMDPVERQRVAAEIHRRLKPRAPFVAAHGSFPQEGEARRAWMDRYEAFAIASGAEPDQARQARTAVEASVMMLAPELDEQILAAGGFDDVSLFYAAFTWRGWIGHA